MTKVDGSDVTEAEARGILDRFGALEVVAATRANNPRTGTMTNGMFVRFAFYLDCRDALRVSFTIFNSILHSF